MKKVFTIISIISISASAAFSQALPNNGFEAWTVNPTPAYDILTEWNTLNTLIGSLGTVTCFKATATGDFHSGAAALKLVTKKIALGGQVVNGIATTGTIDITKQEISGGISYTGRPDSIVGYFKYTPVSTDNGFVQMILTGAGGDTDTVGIATFNTPNTAVAAYVRFAAPFVYKSANAVAKSLCIISSSASATVQFENSTLFVDDLELITKPTGLNQLKSVNVSVGPNPANDFIIVKNSEIAQASFVIYDVTGRVMTQQLITDPSTTIYLNEYKNGLYFYSVSTLSGNLLKSGKIVVQK
jgi:hypothetical protein